MVCMYSGMVKGTSQDIEQQKIKLIPSAIVQLCLSKDISQSVNHSVENSIN